MGLIHSRGSSETADRLPKWAEYPDEPFMIYLRFERCKVRNDLYRHGISRCSWALSSGKDKARDLRKRFGQEEVTP